MKPYLGPTPATSSDTRILVGEPITAKFLDYIARTLQENERMRVSGDLEFRDTFLGRFLRQRHDDGDGFWAMLTSIGQDPARPTAYTWCEATYLGNGEWRCNPTGVASFFQKDVKGKTVLRWPAIMDLGSLSPQTISAPMPGEVVWLEPGKAGFPKQVFNESISDDYKFNAVLHSPYALDNEFVFEWHSGGCYRAQSGESPVSDYVQFKVEKAGHIPRITLPKRDKWPYGANAINVYIADGKVKPKFDIARKVYYVPMSPYRSGLSGPTLDMQAPFDTRTVSIARRDLGTPPLINPNNPPPDYGVLPKPTVAPKVDPKGGGEQYGLLKPGLYWVAYSWIDAVGEIEVFVDACSSVGGEALSTKSDGPANVKVSLYRRGLEYLYKFQEPVSPVLLKTTALLESQPPQIDQTGLGRPPQLVPFIKENLDQALHYDGPIIVPVAVPTYDTSGKLVLKDTKLLPGDYYVQYTYIFQDKSGSFLESMPSRETSVTLPDGAFYVRFFTSDFVYAKDSKTGKTTIVDINGDGVIDDKDKVVNKPLGIYGVNFYMTSVNGPSGSESLMLKRYRFPTAYVNGPAPDPVTPPRANTTEIGGGGSSFWFDSIPDPTLPAIIDPRGGGKEGGEIEPGDYSIRYTFVGVAPLYDTNSKLTGKITYGETLPGPESAIFTVTESGWIPSVKLPDLPKNAFAYNIYLTKHDGKGTTLVSTDYTQFSGSVRFPIAERGGRYEVYAEFPGYATQGGTINANPCAYNYMTLYMEPTTGRCCGSCVDPLPTKFALTDQAGTVTLQSMMTYQTDGTGLIRAVPTGDYVGCHQIPGTSRWNFDTQGLLGVCSLKPTIAAIGYVLTCPKPGQRKWTLTQNWAVCPWIMAGAGGGSVQLTNWNLWYNYFVNTVENTVTADGHCQNLYLGWPNYVFEYYFVTAKPGGFLYGLDGIAGRYIFFTYNEMSDWYSYITFGQTMDFSLYNITPVYGYWLYNIPLSALLSTSVCIDQSVIQYGTNGQNGGVVIPPPVDYSDIYVGGLDYSEYRINMTASSVNFASYFPKLATDKNTAADTDQGRTRVTCRPVDLNFLMPDCAAVSGKITVTELPKQ